MHEIYEVSEVYTKNVFATVHYILLNNREDHIYAVVSVLTWSGRQASYWV